MVNPDEETPNGVDTIQMTIDLMTSTLPQQRQRTRRRRFGGSGEGSVRETDRSAQRGDQGDEGTDRRSHAKPAGRVFGFRRNPGFLIPRKPSS